MNNMPKDQKSKEYKDTKGQGFERKIERSAAPLDKGLGQNQGHGQKSNQGTKGGIGGKKS